jgi:hypothetical protein
MPEKSVPDRLDAAHEILEITIRRQNRKTREYLSRAQRNEAEYQREALDSLKKGILPSGFTAEGYFCKNGEKIIYAFNDVMHYCSAVHSEWTGRSEGTSVRIAKGLWIRTGNNRGHRVQHTTMKEQGGGCLVLTNQALSFVSKEKSARILLSHIMAFEAGSGGGLKDFEFSLETDSWRSLPFSFPRAFFRMGETFLSIAR